MPTPIATYFVQSAIQGTSALTTTSFTPSNGEDIVIKLATWDSGVSMGTPTGGSQTYTSRVINAPGGFNQWCGIYTTTISGSPGSMTISSSPSASSRYSMCVERWAAGSLAASPVTHSTTGIGAVASGTITPTAGTSVISWVSGDAQSVDPATRAYLNSGTDEGVRDDHLGSNGVDYHGRQDASGTGSQSYGLSLPSGQTFVIAAIEILDTGGTPAFTDPIWTPHLLVPPGRISPAGFWTPWPGDTTVIGEIQVPLADDGASAESLAITAAADLADSASGADAVAIAAAVPLADGGSATDSLTVAASVALADAGSESEALTVTATVPLADNGAGAEGLAETATVGLADAGAGADALTVAAAVPLADTGSSAESLDNGTGTSKALGDTGSAGETLTVTVVLALADAGTATEGVAAGASVPLADAGSAGQTFLVSAAISLADAGTAAEALAVAASVALADTGSAADTAIGQDNAFVTKFLNDAGSVVDALSFVPSLITGRPAVIGDPATAAVAGDPVVAKVTGVD